MGRAGSTHTASNWRRPRDVVTPAADGGFVRTYRNPWSIDHPNCFACYHILLVESHIPKKQSASGVRGRNGMRKGMDERSHGMALRASMRASEVVHATVRAFWQTSFTFFLLTGSFIMQRAVPCQSQSHSCRCSCSICHAFMRVSCKEVDVVGWWDDASSVP